METIILQKGRDLKLKGAALKQIISLASAARIAIRLADFRGLKPKLDVQENDVIKVGSPILSDKNNPTIKIVSPVSGKVIAIVRGEKRVLLQIIIESDRRQETLGLHKFSVEEIKKMARHDAIQQLLDGGMWPAIRQRPFSRLANPSDHPKSIFVQGMNSEPLAPDFDFLLQGQEGLFQAGLEVLRRLTDGEVHLCISDKATSPALTQSQNVRIHRFAGPHPTGNVSTHIHFIDPIKKGDIVWYISAPDVLRGAALFLNGSYSGERVVALTGEGADNRVYVKTLVGSSIHDVMGGKLKGDMRYISGSVFNGTNAGQNGFLGFYDSQITVIPEGGERHFLGWLTPGWKAYSFSKTFLSSFFPEKEISLDTDAKGSERAIVLNDSYDRYVALDILTFFLIRAIYSGDIEEAEKLGILECDEEDFALCSFADPSKLDIGGIIRQGLDEIEREG